MNLSFERISFISLRFVCFAFLVVILSLSTWWCCCCCYGWWWCCCCRIRIVFASELLAIILDDSQMQATFDDVHPIQKTFIFAFHDIHLFFCSFSLVGLWYFFPAVVVSSFCFVSIHFDGSKCTYVQMITNYMRNCLTYNTHNSDKILISHDIVWPW